MNVCQRWFSHRRFTHARLLCLAIALLLVAARDVALAADGKQPPNIVLILADDLGYGDVGCYGQVKIETPEIDRMAAEGLRFTQAYAGSTVCAPSRCALMTGLHTGHCRVRGNWRLPLRDEDVTVAEVLKSAGYATGIFGKWGLGEAGTSGIPTRQGFDHWFGYLNQHHAHNYYPTFLWRNETKVPLPGNVVPPGGEFGSGVATEKVTYSQDVIMAEALKFLRAQRADRPFFLYLPFTLPHANNEARKAGMEIPSLAPYENESWPPAQKAHAAMITRLDSDVGRILSTLDELKLADNTLVLFSSDNGPHKEGGADPEFFDSNGPFKGIKRSLYDGGIRVPLIARWPGRVPAGATSEHVTANWDFLPTAAELAGVEPPAELDGISYVPTLLGQKDRQLEHDFLYWEFYEGTRPIAVRYGPWKMVRQTPDGAMELYDVTKDPHEDHNVAKDYWEVLGEVESYLNTCRTDAEIPTQ